jgi:thioredoxin-like negative regulator of GroEL
MRVVVMGLFVLVGLCGCGTEISTATATATVETAPVKLANVVEITQPSQFDAAVNAYQNKTVVVDFHAHWCDLCHKLAPELLALAQAYPQQVVVLTVDIAVVPQLAERFDCEYLPLMVRLQAGKEIARHVGVKKRAELQQWLQLP